MCVMLKPLNRVLVVVIAVAVIFTVRAELHHAKGRGCAGKQIDAAAGSSAGADERVNTGGGTRRGWLRY